MEKLIIYGVGRRFHTLMERMLVWNKGTILKNTIALADTDLQKSGKEFYGKTVIHPEEIKKYNFDKILITSELYKYEIMEMLVHQYSIDKMCILSFSNYALIMWYSKHMSGRKNKGAMPCMKMDAFTTFEILSAMKEEDPKFDTNIEYENILENGYSKFIRHGDAIADVGANRGRHLRVFSKLAKNGEVYAFEPLPELCENLREQFNESSVKIFNVALSDTKSTDTDFYEVIGAEGCSGLKNRDTFKLGEKLDYEKRKLKVEVSTLDNYFEKVERLDYIKLDCEGAECAIIRGGLRTIQRLRPIMSVEYGYGSYSYYSESKNSLFELCGQMGYFITDIFGNLIPTLETWEELCDTVYWDYFLVPKEKLRLFCTSMHVCER
jgi:FkbM family methyltransferase